MRKDTRVVVHILNALEQGMKSVKVSTVDTDVVIILAGAFSELCQTQPLWQTSRLLLARARITGFTASMQSVPAFESKDHELCLFSTR